MTEPLLCPDEAALFKSGIHLCLFGLAMTCLGYNAMRLSVCRDSHHAVNVGVYAALTWFEAQQIRRHLQ